MSKVYIFCDNQFMELRLVNLNNKIYYHKIGIYRSSGGVVSERLNFIDKSILKFSFDIISSYSNIILKFDHN